MPVVTEQEAARHLRITPGRYDSELAAFIAAAEQVLAERVGPLEEVPRTVTMYAPGGPVALPGWPVVSLDAVTDSSGAAVNLSTLAVSGAGVVTGLGSGVYEITYTAGRTTCPPDLRLAVLELVRHLWGSQRGSGGRPGSPQQTETSNTVPGAAYLLPFRVSELIAPHMQHGFA